MDKGIAKLTEGAITKEAYEAFYVLSDKFEQRARHIVFDLLGWADTSEHLDCVNYDYKEVHVITWYTCMGDTDYEDYWFPAEYMWMTDNDVLDAERVKKEKEEEEKRRLEEKKMKKQEELKAKKREKQLNEWKEKFRAQFPNYNEGEIEIMAKLALDKNI